MVIHFTGDINISGSFYEKVINGHEIFSDKLLSFLKSADFTVGNLEGPVTDQHDLDSEKVILKSPGNTIQYLSKRHINLFNLSNNHIFDYGEKGFRETIQKIEENNCKYFAAFNNSEHKTPAVFIEKNGIKVALIGICGIRRSNKRKQPGHCFLPSMKELKKQIKILKKETDYIFVNYHGGEEYTKFPSPPKRRYLKKVSRIDGINFIIANHSHSLQGFEKIGKTYVFYSLGNFIFDIDIHKFYPYTDFSAILSFSVQKDQANFTYFPYSVKTGYINEIASDKIKAYMAEISDFSKYRKKWKREAYRVLFENKKKDFFDENSDYQIKSLKNKTVFGLVFSMKFWLKINQIFKNKILFSIYAHAVIYKWSVRFRKDL